MTKAAFYGDSYTLGIGATGEQHRWSSIICRQRGWQEFNPSINGLGFVRNREGTDLPAEIEDSRPDLLFITMGLNDNFGWDDAPTIHEQIEIDLGRLRQALPDTRIIVVEPFWYTDVRPASLEVLSGWVMAAAANIHADHIEGASHWIEHHPEWMAADGLHPNDAGYAAMAVEMDEALKKLAL